MSKKELVLKVRNLLKDMQTFPQNFDDLAMSYEELNQAKAITPWVTENLKQEINTNFLMIVHIFNVDVKNLITFIYWLIKNNCCIDDQVVKKLENAILGGKSQILDQDWFRLLTIYSNIEKTNEMLGFQAVLKKMQVLSPSSLIETVQAALDLCVLNIYDESIWGNIIPFNLEADYSVLPTLRIISLALRTEAKHLEDSRVGQSIRQSIEKVLDSEKNLTSLTIEKKMPLVSVSKLHREVNFALKSILSYDENYTYEDTYIIDFYCQQKRFGIDLHGPLHYFFPDIGDHHDQMSEDKLLNIFKLKHRLLEKNQMQVASVPYYEWNRYLDHTEKFLYLKRKLRLAKFRF